MTDRAAQRRQAQRSRLWLALMSWGPQTCDELERRTRIPHQSASARLRELSKEGRIRRTGERRKTRHGRPAAVWMGWHPGINRRTRSGHTAAVCAART